MDRLNCRVMSRRNWTCLLASMPGHVLFARYAWMRARASGTKLLVVALAAVAALILADLQTIWVAAATGIVMSAAQFLSMRRVSEASRKLI